MQEHTTSWRADRRVAPGAMIWLLVASVLTDCSESVPEPRSIPEAPSPGPSQPPPAVSLSPTPAGSATGPHKRTRKMMGTIISITVLDFPRDKALAAIDDAFREMEGLEKILSEWLPDSEVSRINAAAGKSAVKVGEHTMTVVKAGLEVSAWSKGAFDLSWAALRGLYSFQPGQQRAPPREEIERRLPLIDYRDIVVDDAASSVMLKRVGMTIGTGSIAKGYALDRAAAVLVSAGIDNFMFFGGGQVQVRGTKHGRPWRVGIQHPRRQDHFAFVEATSGSISTSGDYEHAFFDNGKRWHHILDPRTGHPVPHTSSVTVVAESGLYADALSTAVFVLGADRALDMLPSAPGAPRVAIVTSDMTLALSPGMAKHIKFSVKLDGNKLPL